MTYEHALQQLYQAPLASFLAERKRLSAELRAHGDEAGAAQLAKQAKPVRSVWIVNQLYWTARDAFDALLATAEHIREGNLRATKPHHDALAALRKRAVALLENAGVAANDATLRRVTTTLAAIAATGSFAPDRPGALTGDRDPPGFDALSLPTVHAPAAAAPRRHPGHEGKGRGDDDDAEQRAALRAAELAEPQQREAERVRRTAERARLHTALRAAIAELRTRERELAKLEQQRTVASKAVDEARESMHDLERQLAALADAN